MEVNHENAVIVDIHQGGVTRTNECQEAPDNLCQNCQSMNLEKALSQTRHKEFQANQRLTPPKQIEIASFRLEDLEAGKLGCTLCRLLYKQIQDTFQHADTTDFYSGEYHLQIFPSIVLNYNGYFTSMPLSEKLALANLDDCFLRVACASRFHQGLDSQTLPAIFLLRDEEQFQDIFRVRITQPQADFEYLKRSMKYCQTYHGKICNQSAFVNDQPMALKFIDCNEYISSHRLKIVPGDSYCSFVALSYIWGQHASHKSPGGLVHIPKTIKDAIEATLKLGFRFLWVDQYCIRQDNEDEKLNLIRNMHRIYSSAVATLIDAAGDHDDAGLAGLGNTPRKLQNKVRINWGTLVSSTSHPSITVGNSKWQTRAWTYQEGILSRRRIFLTAEEIIFECMSMFTQESFHTPLNALHYSRKLCFKQGVCLNLGLNSPKIVYQGRDTFWGYQKYWRHVRSYSRRELSYDSDVLNAFRGIADKFQADTSDFYDFYGLPIWFHEKEEEGKEKTDEHKGATKTLSASLRWAHMLQGDESQSSIFRREQFPSWTWAGWRVQIQALTTQLMNWATPEYQDSEFRLLTFSASPGLTIWLIRKDGMKMPLNLSKPYFQNDPYGWNPVLLLQGRILMTDPDTLARLTRMDYDCNLLRNVDREIFIKSLQEGRFQCLHLGFTNEKGYRYARIDYYLVFETTSDMTAVRVGTIALPNPSEEDDLCETS